MLDKSLVKKNEYMYDSQLLSFPLLLCISVPALLSNSHILEGRIEEGV